MGWFDQDQGQEKTSGTTEKQTRPQPQKKKRQGRAQRTRSGSRPSSTAGDGGSTLGEGIHVDGTIVSDEDLTVKGKVEGTLRSRGTLRIAKEAKVRAEIDGRRVLVHGDVEGDLRGSEKVILGPTAVLKGDIEAPALEIQEGAFFKGRIVMESKGRPDREGAEAAATTKGRTEGGSDDGSEAATEETTAARTPSSKG